MRNANSLSHPSSIPWWRRRRWQYASASFLLGVVYTSVAMLLGFEFRLGDRDVTLLGGGLIEVSFAVFGFLLGLTAEGRQQEKVQAGRIQDQLEELAAVQSKLAQQEKLASLGQLAGAVAHEVRNPLAILRSLVQNLAETLPASSSEGRETCDLLLEEIDRLAHVTSPLVGFVRPLSLQRTEVSARAIAGRTELLARQILGPRDLDLTLAGPATGELNLDADPDLVCQVLLGLLDNAAAVSPRGAALELGWRRRGDTVEFAVSDRGPGIPEDLREQVFEPFFTTRDTGTGLGLAVARQIVEAHGGSIGFDEGAGDGEQHGARIYVRLPITPIGEASPARRATLGTAA